MNGAVLLPEFDHEFAITRRMLERVPLEQGEWQPHEKSSSLRRLASHLANIPRWVPMTIGQDVLELDGPYETPQHETVESLLAYFDDGLAEARAVIEQASAEDLGATWSMKRDGEVTMALPKAAVLRSFIFNHNVHHRAQLGVYLRLLDVPVPSTYGPSADESA